MYLCFAERNSVIEITLIINTFSFIDFCHKYSITQILVWSYRLHILCIFYFIYRILYKAVLNTILYLSVMSHLVDYVSEAFAILIHVRMELGVPYKVWVISHVTAFLVGQGKPVTSLLTIAEISVSDSKVESIVPVQLSLFQKYIVL